MKKIVYILFCTALIAGGLAGCASGNLINSDNASKPLDSPSDSDISDSITESKSDSEPSSSEPENDTVTEISNIKDWEKLGLSPDENWYFEYIQAFLNKDTQTLEDMSDTPRGAYDIYKTLEFGDYKITATLNPNHETLYGFGHHIFLKINIVSSDAEYLPEGEYSFKIENGVSSGHFIQDGNGNYNPESAPDTPVQLSLYNWLNTCGSYMFYDYDSLSGEELIWYSLDIMDYLLCTYAKIESEWTLEKVQEYVKKYFGIDGFIPVTQYMVAEESGLYYIEGHGGEIWAYKYINETEENGIIKLTVQFFADASKTVKSHTVEYTMQALDNGIKFIGSKIMYESQYAPYHRSV